MDREDVKLVELVRKGSTDAFRTLVEKYERRAWWIACNMVGNREAARDIAQEAFLRVHRSLATFDTARNFRTWLHQIVVNLCIDHLRRSRNDRAASIDDAESVPAREPDPARVAESRDTQERVQQVLAELPVNYRTVLVLRDIQGFSCEEVAAMTATNPATARWRLHAARKLFKEAWEARQAAARADQPAPPQHI